MSDNSTATDRRMDMLENRVENLENQVLNLTKKELRKILAEQEENKK